MSRPDDRPRQADGAAGGGEELARLTERFGRDLAAIVEQPFWPMLDEHVSGLVALVEESGRACRGLFDGIESLATLADFETDDDRRKFLDTAEGARKSHAETVLTLFQSEDFRATGWRAEDLHDTLLRAADGIGDGYPAVVRTPQEDARFRPDSADPLRLRAAKLLKAALRPIRKEWVRAAPVAAAARFHAAGRFPERAVPVYSGVRRLRVVALVRLHGIQRIVLDGVSAIRSRTMEGASSAEIGAAALDARARLEEEVQSGVRQLRRGADQVVSTLDAAIREIAASFNTTLERVGTLEQPAGSVSSTRQWKRLARATEEQRRASARWDEYEAGLCETMEAQAEFVRLGAAMNAAAARAVASIHGSIERGLRTPIAALRASLVEAGAESAAIFASAGAIATGLPRVHDRIERAFIEQSELLSQRERAGEEVREHVAALVEELQALPSTVSEGRRLVPANLVEIPDEPAEVTFRKAPLRRLAVSFCSGRLPRQTIARARSAEPELRAVGTDIERLKQAIAFNISAAVQGMGTESADASTSAEELVSGVLSRGERQLSELLETCSVIDDALTSDLRDLFTDAADKMIERVAGADVLAMRAEILDEETTRGAASAIELAREGGARVRATAGRLHAGWGRVSAARTWARRKIGLTTLQKTEILSSIDQSVLDERDAAALPRIYQQLFAPAPLEWDQFLTGRDDEIETIQVAFDRWKGGDASAVVVYGEKGSGKTTLLGSASRRLLAGSPVRSLTLDRTVRSDAELLALLAPLFDASDAGSLSDLARRIADQPPTVVMLEEIHNLLLRTVGGFDVLRSFLSFLTATKKSVFWIVTLDQYAWSYLTHVVGLHEHFEFTIDATNLPAHELEAAILARHDVSGYSIRFDIDGRMGASRRFRRLAAKRSEQSAARELFFEELGRIAEGNIFLALFYWLRSITAVEEHTLVFRMPTVVPAGFVESLPLPTLHTIAAAILHGGLTADAHAAVFQRDPAESQLALSSMVDSRLLFRTEDGQYKANKILYRPYVRLLRSKNIF